MLNLTRLHLGIAHESQFQGLGIRPSPQGREDFCSTTQKALCRPPQIRHAALAGKVVQDQRSNAMVSADADVSTNGPTMTFLFTEFANCTAYHPKGTPRYSTAPTGTLRMGPVGPPVPRGTVHLWPWPKRECNGRRGCVAQPESKATAKEPQWQRLHCIVLQCNALA